MSSPHGENRGGAPFAYLMALPVHNPERQALRDRVPFSARKLETLARKFTTPEAFRGKPNIGTPFWEVTNSEPIYPAWAKAKTQTKPLPFESGRNVLPGLEKFARANGIIKR